MKNRLFILPIIFVLLLGSTLAVGYSRDSIKISTRGYVEDTIVMDNEELEGSLIVNLNYRKRCTGFCKFRKYLGLGRIRHYGLDEIGRRRSIEIKRIKPLSLEFAEEYFYLSGKADIIIKYLEPVDAVTKGRVIYRNVPIVLWYDKVTKKLEVEYLMTLIRDIDVDYR